MLARRGQTEEDYDDSNELEDKEHTNETDEDSDGGGTDSVGEAEVIDLKAQLDAGDDDSDDSDDKVTVTYYQGSRRDTTIRVVCKEPIGTTVVLT